MKKILPVFFSLFIVQKLLLAQAGTSCATPFPIYPGPDCNNMSGAQYAGGGQCPNAACNYITMAGTSTLNPACTPDNETTQSVFWMAVTATTTSFTITNNKAYTGSGTSAANTKDYVVYSGTCGSLTQIACATLDASGGAGGSLTVNGLTAGQIYYVMVSPSSGSTSSTAAAPCVTSTVAYVAPGQTCATAQSLTTNVTYTYTNAATNSPSGPICAGSVENDAWYEWCAPASWPVGDTVFLSVFNQICNSTQGLQLSVWNTNTACPTVSTAPTVVCQNPGALTNYYYSWIPTPGNCYYITLDGFAGTACTYSITVGSTVVTSACTSPTASISSQTNVSCNGGANGSATVTATGGTTPYTYSWNTSPVQTTATATGLSEATYTATVVGGSCATTVSVTITAPPILTASISSQTNINCNGGNNGSAAVTAGGGTTGYTYLWSNGQTTSTATGLTAATFTVTVTDSKSCTKTASVTITQPTVLTASISSQTNVLCNGGSSGSATVTAGGGTTNYTYLWSNGQTSATATGLSAASYTVTVTDANSCTKTTSVTITQPVALTASISSQTNVLCNGASTGSATVTAGGGTTNYTYLWSNGQTSATTTGLSAAPFTVTVTDANSCTKTASATITQPTAISTTTASSNSNCGNSDGSASVSASGGTSPYTYLWNTSPAQTNDTASGIPSGNYTVTVTDGNGCTKTATVAVSDNGGPSPTVTASGATTFCQGGSVTLTSSAATSYSWSNGATTQSITVSVSGSYTVTVIVAGCSGASAPITVTVNPTPTPTITPSGATTFCSGGNVTLTSSAASSYNWSTTATTSSISVSTSGSYTVTITDGNGCTGSSATTTVTVNNNPTATITPSGATTFCSGGNVTLSANAASSYFWSTSETTQSINVTSTGNYSVTITDINGCTGASSTTSVTVNPNPTPAITASGATTFCSSGSVTLTSSAANSYLWSTTATSQSISVTTSGSYIVTVTDGNNCSGTSAATTVTVNANPTPTITAAGATTFCSGDSVQLTSSAASTYLWSTGASSQSIYVKTSGSYTVTVTDGNSCTGISSSTTITANSNPSSTTSTTNVTCGSSNGTATVTGSGGTTPYAYQWDASAGNQSTATATGLVAGVYGVTITDDNGCPSVNSATVSSTAGLTATLSSTTATCGNCNGTAKATPSGGTSPYTYQWDASAGNQTTQIATGLCGGTAYFATVTDASGGGGASVFWTEAFSNSCAAACLASSYTTGPNGAWTLTSTGTNDPEANKWFISGAECGNAAGVCGSVCGATDPSLHIGADDGFTTTDPGASYNAGGFCGSLFCVTTSMRAESPTINCSGKTNITVAFNYMENGDTNIDDATLWYFNGSVWAQIDPLAKTPFGTCSPQGKWTAFSIVLPATANNNSNVKIGFNWTNNDDGIPSNGDPSIAVDDITVTGTSGGSGCTYVLSVNVTATPAITATASSTNATCGANDGTATANPSGGTSPFTYFWSNSQTTQTATGLGAGTFSVTVTDANSCSTTSSATVNAAASPTLGTTSINVSCNSGNDGQASVTASGGTTPYTYSWSGGQSTVNITGQSAGTYYVTVTDANSCTVVDSATISQPAALSVSASPTNVLCNGNANGQVSTSVSGGTTTYSYLWSNSQTGATATGLSGGTYTVTVTDNKGCTKIVSATVNEPAVLSATTSLVDALCNGASTGSASVAASGGTTNYSYLWSNGQTGATDTSLTAGTYNVTVTDANGCTKTSSATVAQPTAINISVTSTDANCGATDGTATAAPSGGTTPYSYLWNNGQTGATATALAAGNYNVTITDGNSCTQITTATVSNVGGFSASASATNVSCNGSNNGTATATPSGGATPITYLWDAAAANQTTATATGLGTGNYSVTVTDNIGCTFVALTTVSEPSALTSSATSTGVSCSGNTDGTANVTASGGTTPYTYLWSDGQTGATATGLPGGAISVTVTDNNSCTTIQTTTVNQPAPFSASTTFNNETCGNSNGTATVSAVGGTTPYSYLWSNGQTGATATSLTAGNYSITITDVNGCSATASATLTNVGGATVTATAIDATCNGTGDGSATATATGGTTPYSYLWSNGQTGATATSLIAGNYSVTVTDGNNCATIASDTVNQPAAVVAAISPSSTSICSGNSAILTAAGGGTYQWSTGATTSVITVNPTSDSTFIVTVTVGACSDTESVSITVNSPPTAVIAGDSALCSGGSAILAASGNGTYLWSTGAITYSITVFPSADSIFSVTVTNSCGSSSSTVNVNISLSPTPTISNDTTIVQETSVTLIAGGGTNYLWNTIPSQTTPSVSVTPTATTTYIVTVTNSFGCSDTAEVKVTIDFKYVIFVPSMFSPNGDTKNDALFVRGKGIKEMYFVIYDRWGEIVFESFDISMGWDGKFRGKEMNTAVFVYILNAKMDDGENIVKKGNITLVR